MSDLLLKENLQTLKDDRIKKKEGVIEPPDPRMGDLGALRDTEFPDWKFLAPLVDKYYSDDQKDMWKDEVYMVKSFNLLVAYVANKLMKKPEVVQQLLDLLFLMYGDIKKAEIDQKIREEKETEAVN